MDEQENMQANTKMQKEVENAFCKNIEQKNNLVKLNAKMGHFT